MWYCSEIFNLIYKWLFQKKIYVWRIGRHFVFNNHTSDTILIWNFCMTFITELSLIKISCYICYTPPNIWHNPIRGHFQMNFHIWILIWKKSTNHRALHLWCGNKKVWKVMLRFFIDWLRVHLHVTSNQVLSDVRGECGVI